MKLFFETISVILISSVVGRVVAELDRSKECKLETDKFPNPCNGNEYFQCKDNSTISNNMCDDTTMPDKCDPTKRNWTLITMSCPKDQYYNAEIKNCSRWDFKCTSEGKSIHPFHLDRYIRCVKIGKTFYAYIFNCPNGSYFTGYSCVKTKMVACEKRMVNQTEVSNKNIKFNVRKRYDSQKL